MPRGVPPMEGTKKIQYPERYKNATGKGLWSGEDNEVFQGVRDIWGNINSMSSWRDQHDPNRTLKVIGNGYNHH